MKSVITIFVISFFWLESYSQQINIPFRLNIGSKEEFKTADGKVFLADPPEKPNPYIVGGGGFINKEGVTEGGGVDRNTNTYTNYTRSTVDPLMELYNSERWSGGKEDNLKFAFPVPNGKYDIITYHSEGYFGADFVSKTSFGGQTPEGLCVRVFDIYIENTPVLNHFDIYEYTGAAQVGITLKFSTIEVVDGQLNIDFIKSKSSYTGPSINAIEILPAGAEITTTELVVPSGKRLPIQLIELKEGATAVNHTFELSVSDKGIIDSQFIEVNKGSNWQRLTWDGTHEFFENKIRIRKVPESISGYQYRLVTNYACTIRYSSIIELKIVK